MPLPTPQATWSAIAARLEGVERTAMTYAGFLGNSSAKSLPGADDVIFDACVSTWKAIQQFRTDFGDALPPVVSMAIDNFASANGAKIVTGGLGADFTAKRVIVMKLMLLGGEITHGRRRTMHRQARGRDVAARPAPLEPQGVAVATRHPRTREASAAPLPSAKRKPDKGAPRRAGLD